MNNTVWPASPRKGDIVNTNGKNMENHIAASWWLLMAWCVFGTRTSATIMVKLVSWRSPTYWLQANEPTEGSGNANDEYCSMNTAYGMCDLVAIVGITPLVRYHKQLHTHISKASLCLMNCGHGTRFVVFCRGLAQGTLPTFFRITSLVLGQSLYPNPTPTPPHPTLIKMLDLLKCNDIKKTPCNGCSQMLLIML